ncbi:two-component system response regulator CpxR [Methylovorus glucosotrophus]|jgi:two-component system, OmpR family, response regulator|nr:two-component system response regulator CpxR [Methylovorus glucosotrophus]
MIKMRNDVYAMNKVLLIDDDVELVGMLKEYLEQEGFDPTVAYDGESGAEQALRDTYDLILLDVMMPKMNGIDALRAIRAEKNTPVLMLTAKGEDADRIVGLELGADDYVPKPCTPREIVARVRAILRRTQPSDNAQPVQITVGALTLWPEQRRAEWSGNVLELTSTEFNLLEVLVRHAGRVVSKSDLSLQGLGRPLARFDRSIDVHLSSIRQKIDAYANGRHYIQTVYRMGYQLVRE